MDLLLCEAFDGIRFWSKRQFFFIILNNNKKNKKPTAFWTVVDTFFHHVLMLTEELELGGLKVLASGCSWELL